MKIPQFVMLIYADGGVKGYNWVAFKKVVGIVGQDYAKRKLTR